MAEEEIADPRLASPIWEGRYEVTPAEGVTLSSATVMLTKANVCQLCGDAEGVTAGAPFATLPEECRPARELHLPVCVGGSGSEAVSLEGTVTIAGQTATGTVSVGASKGTGTVTLTSEPGSENPMLVSGEFDESGELVSAYAMRVINNTSPLSVSGDVEVEVPEQSASASIEIAEQEVPVTVSGNVATGGLATLTIGTNGTMTCSSGGTVYLDGFSYHICDRWY